MLTCPHRARQVIVYSNGTLFWSRPGEISSVCQLFGLQNFPYDSISCKMRFGGWSLGASHQNLSFYEPAAIDTTQVRDTTFQEYRVLSSSVERGVDVFSCCPDEAGWPYVEFEIALARASKHYDIKIVYINMLLTYLSFGVFLLDPKVHPSPRPRPRTSTCGTDESQASFFQRPLAGRVTDVARTGSARGGIVGATNAAALCHR